MNSCKHSFSPITVFLENGKNPTHLSEFHHLCYFFFGILVLRRHVWHSFIISFFFLQVEKQPYPHMSPDTRFPSWFASINNALHGFIRGTFSCMHGGLSSQNVVLLVERLDAVLFHCHDAEHHGSCFRTKLRCSNFSPPGSVGWYLILVDQGWFAPLCYAAFSAAAQ